MTSWLCENMSAQSDFHGEYLPVAIGSSGKNVRRLASIQFSWKGMNPDAGSVFTLSASNDGSESAVLGTVEVKNTDNSDDNFVVLISTSFAFYGISFSPGNNARGTYSISAYYE